MKTSLMEMVEKVKDSLFGPEAGLVNDFILQESESLSQMNDSLFMEWFIKKEERIQLYERMMNDIMSEESIWYTSDSTKFIYSISFIFRVYSLSSSVTKNMIRPQIEIKYVKQLVNYHSAASVWENEKTTPTPTTPTPSTSAALIHQKLPSSLLTLSCSMIKPLQVIKGTIYLSKDSLAFIVDPELKKERMKKIAELEEKINGGKKGENKWKMLDELKNEIWDVNLLQAEEFRLYQVVLLYLINNSSVTLLLNFSS